MDPKQKCTLQGVWQGINGVIFVPHYNQTGVFMAPGGRSYTVSQLIAGGASLHSMMLWPRGRE